MTRTIVGFGAIAIISFLTGAVVTAQTKSAWPWSDSQDGYLADPAHHRVLFEYDNVRILEVTLAPGAKENPHVHKLSSVFVIDQWPKFTTHQLCNDAAYCDSGKDTISDRMPASKPLPIIIRGAPVGLHYATNEDSIPFHGYKIEYKKLSIAKSGLM